MGLFSSHKHDGSHIDDETNRDRIFVLARVFVAANQHGEEKSDPEIFWSLVVEGIESSSSQHSQRPRHRKPLFGTKQGSSKSQNGSDQQDLPDHPIGSTHFNEFTQESGALHTYRGEQIQCLAAHGSQPSYLLKAHLKLHAQSLTIPQSLAAKVEKILSSLTSSDSHLAKQDSATWVRHALVSLQHTQILSCVHDSYVNDFINFVKSKISEFETGPPSVSTGEGDPELVIREIDYQRHLDENARVKMLLGNDRTEISEGQHNNWRNSASEGPPGIRGGFGGGFWTTRPNGNTRINSRVNPYGGLM